MNPILARKVFEAGARARNPSLFEQYDYLKSTEWLSKEKLNEIQLENLTRFLRFTEENSDYYRNAFNDAGFSSSKISSLDDIKSLPEIDKKSLIENNKAIHAGAITEKVRLAETSGTSGAALAFNRNERWDSLNRATLMRAYDWYGVKPWDRNGYLWGYNISSVKASKTRLLDTLQNRFRIFKYDDEEIKKFCQKLNGSEFISGYSSMVYEVAKRINKLGLGPVPLRMVKGTSEMILDAYQPEAEKAFGRKIISEYGAAETGLIAFECPEGGIHINVENVVLEHGEHGDLLVTNLASYSFPIIRYRLGDMVTLSDETCPCGRSHPLIKDIVGRKGANVQGASGSYPALTFYYVFKNLALEDNILINYKAIQRVHGEVEILIEGESNKAYTGKIEEQLQKYFGDDVVFKMKFVEGFEKGLKKNQYFETLL